MSNTAIKQHYSRYPYPHISPYTDDNLRLLNCKVGMTIDTPVPPQHILVVGCGTVEANIVARTYPRSHVTGIDLSQESIDISQEITKVSEIQNVSYIVGDFLEHVFDKKFSIVYANGVLHHNIDAQAFVNKVWDSMESVGYVSGMVYDTGLRQHILETREKTLPLAEPKKVHEFLEGLDEFHPSKQWFNYFQQTDTELADTWLNPYAKHYTTKELETLLSSVGFKPHEEKFIVRRTCGKMAFFAIKNTL